MSTYQIYSAGLSIFDAFNGSGPPRSFAAAIEQFSATELKYRNADGSYAILKGVDFVHVPSDFSPNEYLYRGDVLSGSHYSASGVLIDSFVLSVTFMLQDLYSPFYPYDINRAYYQSLVFRVSNAFDLSSSPSAVNLGLGYDVDVVTLTPFSDTAYGSWGSDTIFGGLGDDLIYGDIGIPSIFDPPYADELHGGGGNDRVLGEGGDDALFGDAGDDILFGLYGSDTLSGGSGTDTAVFLARFSDLKIASRTGGGFTVTSWHGTQSLTGVERIAVDDGIFQYDAAAGVWNRINTTQGAVLIEPERVVRGTNGNDTIDAGTDVRPFGGSHVFSGLGGNDRITGYQSSSDLIYGGAGNDTLSDNGFVGDRMYGGDGNDRVTGGEGDDRLSGNAGNDILVGDRFVFAASGDKDRLYGDDGDDVLQGGAGNDYLWGGLGNDTAVYETAFSQLKVVRTASGFTVTAPDGTDTLVAIERIATDTGIFINTGGNTWVRESWQSGANLVNPTQVLSGTAGADVLEATTAKGIIYGLDGDDNITSQTHPRDGAMLSLLFGGSGNDTLIARTGRLYGGNDDDSLSIEFFQKGIMDGGAGNDTLWGGGILIGGYGNDTLTGDFIGGSSDIMTGGSGADTFVFRYKQSRSGAPESWGNDVITDFTVGVDRLDITATRDASSITPILQLTTDGWLVKVDAGLSGSVLLKGVTTAGLTLSDLTMI
jgi:Ca2+-binding RTX toxin-like protein